MYLDTSVLVKLYCREDGADDCETIASRATGFFSSELLHGELCSALLRKERSRTISAGLREEIWRLFLDHVDAGRIQLLPLNGLVVREAAEVMTQLHPTIPLRALDAIHLATYLCVDAGPLFSCDKRMLEAARKLGLNLAGE
jgi:predicted nucleic acid-binding protein